jgi:tetratricopeptide (TPR) repeat protein
VGFGGFGKTTLAEAVCHDDDVIAAFHQGVLWVSLGQERPDYVEISRSIHWAFHGQMPGFDTQQAALDELRQLLADKNCLIVIDDVWDVAHLTPLERMAPHAARLVTTRDHTVAHEPGSRPVGVVGMSPDEATELLARRILDAGADSLDDANRGALRSLGGLLGKWPQLLELAGAAIRARTAQQSLRDAVAHAEEVMRREGIVGFDVRKTSDRLRAMGTTIGLSLEQLTPEERTAYLQLGVFAKGVAVPFSALAALWHVDGYQCERWAEALHGLSLLQLDLAAKQVEVNDALRNYLEDQLADPAAVHARLLAGWGGPSLSQWQLPDDFAWHWVGHHLVEAGQAGVLADLCWDLRWMEEKFQHTGTRGLLEDLARVSGGLLADARRRLAASAAQGRSALEPARVYAALPENSGRLRQMTQKVAERIVSDPQPHAELAWVLSWLDEPALSPLELLRLCNKFQFDLHDALARRPCIGRALLLLSTVRDTLDEAHNTKHPAQRRLQRDLSISTSKLGDALRDQGDAAGALAHYRASLEISGRLAEADPTSAEAQRDLSINYLRLGDVLRVAGDAAEALGHYRASLDINRRLAEADPSSAEAQRDLSVSYERLGDVLRTQGDAAGAMSHYQASLGINRQLAEADPTSAQAQRDLSVSMSKLGDVLRAQGDATGSLSHYRASLEIRQRLAEADPTSAQAQRDLSVSLNRLGDALRVQGDAAGAMSQYQASLEISRQLAEADPTSAQAQRDLLISYGRLGDALRAHGDAVGSLSQHQASLAISRRLAEADPTNAQAQRDLSVSLNRLGDALRAQGDAAGAMSHYQASLEINRQLAEADPTSAQAQRDLSISMSKLGDVLRAQGDAIGSLSHYRASLEICQRLAEADPTSAETRRDLWVSCWRIAEACEALGQADEAAAWWLRAYETLHELANRGTPLSSEDQEFLARLASKTGRQA